MKNVVKFTMCLLAVFFAFSAKAVDKSELLGSWTQTVNEGGVMVISTYDFKDNDKVTQFLIMNSTSPKINIVADGTCDYSLKDDAITFKFSGKDFNFSTFEFEGLPQEAVGMAQQQMINEMVNVEQKLTDIKINGDTMTAKFNGEEVTLKRK